MQYTPRESNFSMEHVCFSVYEHYKVEFFTKNNSFSQKNIFHLHAIFTFALRSLLYVFLTFYSHSRHFFVSFFCTIVYTLCKPSREFSSRRNLSRGDPVTVFLFLLLSLFEIYFFTSTPKIYSRIWSIFAHVFW